MKIFYLTSTGNSLYVARKIGGELNSIAKLLSEGKKLEFKADKIGIVFPCYMFGVPHLVKEFLSKAKLESDYIFAVVTYGSFSAGVADMFIKTAEGFGNKISYINEVLMVDNYIPLFDIETQIEGIPGKKIDEQIDKVCGDIKSSAELRKTGGVFMEILSRIAAPFFERTRKTADLRFAVEESCNSCKICEKVCPVGNITVTVKPEFHHNCEKCFACTHNCPQNSIRVKGEKGRTRWTNEHVKTKEIIDANNTVQSRAAEPANAAAKVSAKKAVKAAGVKSASVKAAPKAAPKAAKKAAPKAAPKKAVEKSAAKSVKKAAPKSAKTEKKAAKKSAKK